jgi:hypothetical protein
MPKKKLRNSPMLDYLERKGLLAHGSDAQIEQAKAEYRKQYQRKYKRKQREKHQEFTIILTNKEAKRIEHEADRYNTSPSAFVRDAAFAYLDKTFIVPDLDTVIGLEQLLSQCRSDIRRIADNQTTSFLGRAKAYHQMAKTVKRLENEIARALRNPEELEQLLSHDH